MKKNILLCLIFTLTVVASQAQISTFPWTEEFETSGLPSGWSQQYVNATANWVTYSGGSYGMPSSAYSGSKNAFFSADNYDDNQTILVSPQLDLSALSNPVLCFYHTQIPFDTDQDKLYIYYKTSAAGPWILLQSYTTAVMNWTQRTILLPEVSSDFYIGFSAKSGYGLGICLDAVQVVNQPSCLNPGNISITQTTNSGAVIDWTNGGSESQWQIEYGIQGFTQGGGTIVNTSTHPYTFTGLVANESYEFYIRSYCNPVYGSWIGPFSFSTTCSVANIFPYHEGFENTTAPVACWRIEYANPSPNSGNLVTHSTQFAFEGSRSVKFSSYFVGAPYTQYLISREFNFPQEMQLSFRYRKNTSGTEVFAIGFSSTTDALSSFTWSSNVSDASTSWKYFSSNVPSNTKYIAIQYKSNFQNSLFVDDLKIRNAANCYEPIDLNIANITATSAILSWTAVNGETAWIVEYGTAGFTQGFGNIVNTGLNPYTITGLNSETNYDVYVKSNCGGSESVVSSKLSFTTPPSCLAVTNLSITANTENTVSLTWNSTSAVFYEIEYGISGFVQGSGTTISSISTTDQTITGLSENTSYDFYIRAYCGAINGFSEWSTPVTRTTYPCANGCFYTFTLSDYWGDGWGNVSLAIIQNGDLTNTLSIPSGYSSEYEVFICTGADIEIVLNQGSFANECAFSVYSPYDVFICSREFESLGSLPDQTILYSFNASCSEPGCYPPVNPSYSQLSYNSCNIVWQAGNTETMWNIEYGISGFTPGTGTFVNAITSLNYLLDFLASSTSYDVYIYSDCDVSGLSNATGPVSFTTLAAPLGLDMCGLNLDIPDNSFTIVNFEVSGLTPTDPYTHYNLESVSFVIEHPYDGDIDMYLESPDGVVVTLIEDIGGIDDNFGDVGGSCSFKTILSLHPIDGSIISGTAPFNGNYSAIENINSFNTGADLNGIWKLRLVDDNNLFVGKLQYFNLSFVQTMALATTSNIFTESLLNDGSISNGINLELYNETFATTGLLSEGSDFNVENLPAGLLVEVNVTGANTAVITLTGAAIEHVTDISNLIIRFESSAFTGLDAMLVEGTTQTFIIDFFAVQNIVNNSIDDIIICEDGATPVFVPYSILNNGEASIIAGTEISIILEYPVGMMAFTKSITLDSNLEIDQTLVGSFSDPLFFGSNGTFIVKTIVTLAGEPNIADNETLINYITVTHQNVFPQAINDTIYATEFPYGISTTAIFTPSEYSQTLFYFWNGEVGSSSFDVFNEGWVYLNTESSYCNIEDSIYIALTTMAQVLSSAQVNVYPNPADDIIFVESAELTFNKITICGIDGRIYSQTMVKDKNSKCQISISDLSAGLYFVIAESEKETFKMNFIKL